MDLKTCYEELGGDYENVLGRLSREQLVEKFMLKFLTTKATASLWRPWKPTMSKRPSELPIR